MDSKRMILTTLVLVAFTAVALAPTASAQGTPLAATEFSFTGAPNVKAPANGVIPGLAAIDVDFNWRFATQTSVGSLAGEVGGAILTWDVGTCDPNIELSGAFSEIIGFGAQTAEVTGTTTFSLSLNPNAPGLEQLSCEMTGQITGGGSGFVTGTDPVSSRFTVSAAYVPQLQAVVSGKIAQGGPQKEVHYPIKVTNFGNAQTVVTFALTAQPDGGNWEALAPENVILFAPQSGLKFEEDIDFVVSTDFKNGWNNGNAGYTLQMTPVAFLDNEKTGLPTNVNILTKVRGVYIPALEPFLMVGALLGTALLARLRGSDDE